MDLEKDPDEMYKLAKKIMSQAYAPYSGYKVGAVIKDEHGNLHQGVNVENAAYTGSHGEYGAISAMLASMPQGKCITAVTIVTKDGGTPCGNCLQHIWQFCNGIWSVPIYCGDVFGKIKIFQIKELLPFPFDFEF
ncbi:MAG: cytidine deaminase [Patescibacteria group bacterium]|nr:cytidine deaminase [Patescibacteria group bacterium]